MRERTPSSLQIRDVPERFREHADIVCGETHEVGSTPTVTTKTSRYKLQITGLWSFNVGEYPT